jgi:hypothetical protein
MLKQAATGQDTIKEGVKKAAISRKDQEVHVAINIKMSSGEVILWTAAPVLWFFAVEPISGPQPVPLKDESKKTPGSGS